MQPIPYEVRKDYACEVCCNIPDENGMIEHAGNCAYRPDDPNEQHRIKARREELAKKAIDPRLPADIAEADSYVAARGNYVDRKTVYLDAIHTRDTEIAALRARVVLLSAELTAIKGRARAHCEHCGWTDRFIDRDEAAAKIREHVKVCEKHPMFALKAELTAVKIENTRLRAVLDIRGNPAALLAILESQS